MRVYLTGSQHRAQPIHRMFVSPATDIQNEEVPRDWVNDQNEPVQIAVDFAYGVAEVPPSLGKYMISRGLVAKTKLILPHSAALLEA
ncbi:hypothetical protein [Rhizobium lusitanum]|uniref:hypothetical protein n=1 Tax=Rhizobium lusitanum TaxID=293958 RepID=UPI00195D31F4|nr:hypothetical protein [Rhizobium lusitanum]MBM7045435.1 hypothetical protein [Rhizobium lusitanum]